MHRNICPERLFIDNEGTVKLDYFGHFYSNGVEETSKCSIYGNLSCVSPELLKENS